MPLNMIIDLLYFTWVRSEAFTSIFYGAVLRILAQLSENIAHLGKYSTLGKNKCSVAIWPILLLNSVQIVTIIDRWLLNGLLMQDYVPFVLTAIQWSQEAPLQFVRINQPVQYGKNSTRA